MECTKKHSFSCSCFKSAKMDAALKELIDACSALIEDYRWFVSDLQSQLEFIQYKICAEINHDLMKMLRDMRAERVPPSSIVGIFQSPWTAFTNLDLEEWTHVSGHKYNVDRHLARGFCSKHRLHRDSDPKNLSVEFYYKVGPGMMVEKLDPSVYEARGQHSILTIYPTTRTEGTVELKGWTTGEMQRVNKRAKYTTGWLDAVREIGFF